MRIMHNSPKGRVNYHILFLKKVNYPVIHVHSRRVTTHLIPHSCDKPVGGYPNPIPLPSGKLWLSGFMCHWHQHRVFQPCGHWEGPFHWYHTQLDGRQKYTKAITDTNVDAVPICPPTIITPQLGPDDIDGWSQNTPLSLLRGGNLMGQESGNFGHRNRRR